MPSHLQFGATSLYQFTYAIYMFKVSTHIVLTYADKFVLGLNGVDDSSDLNLLSG